MAAPRWLTAAQNNPEVLHALEMITAGCEHEGRIRRVRFQLSGELTQQWQQASVWRFWKRAKLRAAIDALDELTERLSQ